MREPIPSPEWAETKMPEEPIKPVPPSHGEHGHFTKGNKLAAGPDYIRKMIEFRKLELNTITKKDFRACIKKLVTMALGGDIKALKMVVERGAGKLPAQQDITVSTVDTDGTPKQIVIQLEKRETQT